MTIEKNKAIVRRFFKAFAANDQAVLKEVLAPDIVGHAPGTPGPRNREEALLAIGMWTAAFSEMHFTIEDLIAEGDKVAAHVSVRATHSGEFLGQPPTGKQIAIIFFSVERIKDGQIVERWALVDMMSLMQQLGLVPPPG